MAKVIINGRPLIRDGAPALSTACCCDNPPPPCPNCCISIDWGTFNGDGDLFDPAFTGLEFKIIMPTKNSRLVCADEEITVVIDILDTESPPTGTPYISWDRHWEYISHTPAVGTDGMVFEEGLIEWGTTIPIAEEYSVTLKLNECWSDNDVQYGDIEAGMRGGDFVLISGTNCTSAECCEPVFPCDDCCWVIEPHDNTANAYEMDDANNPVFWAVNAFGDRAQIKVEGTNSGVYCLGEQLTIRMKLVPNEYTGDAWIPEAFISADSAWKRVSNDPDVGNGSVEIGPDPPMSIEWGDDVEGFEYVAVIEIPCPVEAPDSLTVGFQNKYPGGPGAASIRIDFACCSSESSDHSCEDCWPAPEKVCCSIGWNGHAVVSETALQAIRDMITDGSMLPDDQWKMVFGIMSSANNNTPEYPKEVHLALHFVACGYPTIDTPEVDPCTHLENHVCAMLLALDINSLCNLEFSSNCYTDSTTFQNDATWLDGHQYEVTIETLVDEPGDAECDPCPPVVP